MVKYTHFGEGNYTETENEIRKLLSLTPIEKESEKVSYAAEITPETYLGSARAVGNNVTLKGPWQVDSERIISQSDTTSLELKFIANNVYLVMESPEEKVIQVLLDDKNINKITVKAARMYTVCELKNSIGYHKLTLKVPKGVSLYAFTFG